MDDTHCYQYFLEPSDPLQRQYEALRAVFIDGRPQQEVAEQFGYTYGTLRQMMHEFRRACRDGASPFSGSRSADAR